MRYVVISEAKFLGGGRLIAHSFFISLLVDVIAILVWRSSIVSSTDYLFYKMVILQVITASYLSFRSYKRMIWQTFFVSMILSTIFYFILEEAIEYWMSTGMETIIGFDFGSIYRLNPLFGAFTLIAGLGLGAFLARLRYGRRMIQDGFTCPQCTYCLLGMSGDRCPECGWEIVYTALGVNKSDFKRIQLFRLSSVKRFEPSRSDRRSPGSA